MLVLNSTKTWRGMLRDFELFGEKLGELYDKFYKTNTTEIFINAWLCLLLYMRKKRNSRMQSVEMIFLKYVKECTKANKIRNVTIRSDRNISSVNNKIGENKAKWNIMLI